MKDPARRYRPIPDKLARLKLPRHVFHIVHVTGAALVSSLEFARGWVLQETRCQRYSKRICLSGGGLSLVPSGIFSGMVEQGRTERGGSRHSSRYHLKMETGMPFRSHVT